MLTQSIKEGGRLQELGIAWLVVVADRGHQHTGILETLKTLAEFLTTTSKAFESSQLAPLLRHQFRQ